MPCDDCSRAETCPPCVNDEDSARSSLDDLCNACGDARRHHYGSPEMECAMCERSWRHAFVPADAESAGEPERIDSDCILPTGCRDKLNPGCAYGCAEAADEVTRLGQEMEAPPPRRPPYVVAYTIASGEMYEVALPGDAVATVEHGVLKISHPAGVACILQVRPTGEQ